MPARSAEGASYSMLPDLIKRQRTANRVIRCVVEVAPRVGLEPTTLRLTAACSTIELPRNKGPMIRQLIPFFNGLSQRTKHLGVAKLEQPCLRWVEPAPCPGGGTGRRAAFRMLCPYGRGGSSPLQGTAAIRMHLRLAAWYASRERAVCDAEKRN